MGEAIEPPYFVIAGNPNIEDQAYEQLTPADDLRAFEYLINQNPMAMYDALQVYRTGLEPSNRHKSLTDLVLIENPNLAAPDDSEQSESTDPQKIQEKVQAKVSEILPRYSAWETYFRSRLYQLLDSFDETTEAEIASNEDIKATYKLMRDPRNSERAGLKDQYRELWLAQKMSVYVGRVAMSQLDEIHPFQQTGKEPNGKVA